MPPILRNALCILAVEIVLALPATIGAALACEWWATRAPR